ncbi:MAG: hypothetical protein WCW67_04845 [Candidatus Margulisiibacteriota bacterium]|jgi:hypothetical protein
MGKISGVVFAFLLTSMIAIGAVKPANSEVNINVNIGPPPIVVAEPSEVVFISSYGVYFVSGIDFDVYYFNGYWWSPRGTVWYRATAYNGPWVIINRRVVPPVLIRIPANYRVIYKSVKPIPFGKWKQQWKQKGKGYGRGDNQKKRTKP